MRELLLTVDATMQFCRVHTVVTSVAVSPTQWKAQQHGNSTPLLSYGVLAMIPCMVRERDGRGKPFENDASSSSNRVPVAPKQSR
jgi:hypothetical protein